MAYQNSIPFYEKYWYKHNYKRVTDSLLLILLLSLLGYRVISINNYSLFTWFVAFLCESWFTFSWFLTLTTQWSPAVTKTYPHRLLQSVEELPPVDLFVTTADPELEPPIITVNTVLSLLALDYPPHKLACYVSDDGCSPRTFYALQEASQFAKFWVPFCKKYHVQVRAPFRYFSDKPEEVFGANNTPEFKQEWLQMKDMYDNLSSKIELDSSIISNPCNGDFAVFSNTERTNHPSIIQVIWENKEHIADGLPHLIYISREKRPKQPHHYKAGAMNVLMAWIYGSVTEDVLTGLTIHKKGWRSEFCMPSPIGFTGFAPGGGPNSMAQQKRWATGLLEMFFCKHCPIISTLFHKLTLRQCLAYMWIINHWGLMSVFEVCYACLLAYCIITNSNFLPQDLGICIPAAFLVIYKIYTASEYLAEGLSIRAWWNNQRMSRITPMNAGFCAFLSVLLKLFRISETVFDITKKDLPSAKDVGDDKDAGRYTFDESVVFLPGTTILLVQLTAMVIKLLGFQPPVATQSGKHGCGLGEIFCSVYLIICYWPFLRGLFETGKYRIPLSTILKSAILTCLFVHLCQRTVPG
ncbi:hypothetical protein JHK86_017003 [Glycine max]|nr:hypothetical protein JHK86_017003 [Glycine max]